MLFETGFKLSLGFGKKTSLEYNEENEIRSFQNPSEVDKSLKM